MHSRFIAFLTKSIVNEKAFSSRIKKKSGKDIEKTQNFVFVVTMSCNIIGDFLTFYFSEYYVIGRSLADQNEG